jgi:hypothetical protein
LRKGIITAENFGALMILYFEIGGHVLTPFLDTYPGTCRVWIGRWSNGNWSAKELPMRIVTDEEMIEYD